MIDDVSDDLAVEVYDQRHRYGVREGEDGADEVAGLVGVGEVIEGAGG